MAITAIRNLTSDEAVIQDLTVRILTIPSLRGLQWDLSSPEVIEQGMKKIITAFQNPDPFRALKLEQNRVGQSLYPTLKKLVQEADDPLQAAVKMAIMGNAIDLMISDRPLDLEKTLVQGLEQPWPEKPFVAFKKKLEQTRSLPRTLSHGGGRLPDLRGPPGGGLRNQAVNFVVFVGIIRQDKIEGRPEVKKKGYRT